MIIWRKEKKKIYVKRIIAKKKKKKRVKNVKKLMKQNAFISDHILISIEDPEAIWRAIDPTWQVEKAKKQKAMRKRERAAMNMNASADEAVTGVSTDEVIGVSADEAHGDEADEAKADEADGVDEEDEEDEEETTFILNTTIDPLTQDFMAFEAEYQNEEQLQWMGYE